jgi:hypothetical protein
MPSEEDVHPNRVRPFGWERAPAWKGRVSPEALGGAQHLACAGCCSFYRPERTDDERCAGYFLVGAALERFRVTGRAEDLLACLADLGLGRRRLTFAFDDDLGRAMCSTCPFLPDGGCDHRNPALPVERRLEPCGGYVLLAALLECGCLTREDLAALAAEARPGTVP